MRNESAKARFFTRRFELDVMNWANVVSSFKNEAETLLSIMFTILSIDLAV